METQSSTMGLAVSGAFGHCPFPGEKLPLGHVWVDDGVCRVPSPYLGGACRPSHRTLPGISLRRAPG